MKLAVIGAGYVGLVTAVTFAEHGHNVFVVEKDKNKVKQLQNCSVPFMEPGVDVLLKKYIGTNLLISDSLKDVVRMAEIIFIAVGTPSLPNGEADLSAVFEVAQGIGRWMDGYKVIVVKSTVPISTNSRVKQEISHNLRFPIDFDVVSNPEFLREGNALNDARYPSRIVVGVDSKKAADLMLRLYDSFSAPKIITDFNSAEMIKYASNAFLATKISFINEIANLCEKVNADIVTVAYGMGLDSRIGPDFLKAGIGYGGSCFPKDTKALIQIAGHFAHDFKLLKAVVEVNKKQWRRITEKLRRALGQLKNRKIAVWGLSFKPNTDDLRGAPAIEIIRDIKERGGQVNVYDPVAMDKARQILGDVNYSRDAYEAVDGTDAVALVTEWEEFKNVDLVKVRNLMKIPVFIDGRNVFEPVKMWELGFVYHSIGRPLTRMEYGTIMKNIQV